MSLVVGARDFKLDSNGDLVIDSGDLAFVTEGDAIKQACQLALELVQGEWFLDETIGLPYYEQVLVKSPNLNAIRALFRNKLLSIAGVTDVKSISLSYDGRARKLTIDWRVNTDFGELSGTV